MSSPPPTTKGSDPGLHPWIVGESEGRNVLDAARAARNLKATAAGTKLLMFGHSQGGGPALFW